MKQKFKDCLDEEIKFFDPKLIMTFGKVAELVVSDKKLSFIHPTFTANKHWAKCLSGRATNNNKLNYMKNEIENSLKALNK